MLLQVRSVTSLRCDRHPAWCQQLLQLAAPHLEELQLSGASSSEHVPVLLELLRMPRLTKLTLYMGYGATVSPALPPHLEELELVYPTGKQLRSVQCMDRLKKLLLILARGLKNVPGLPTQLEELKVLNPARKQLQSMTVLRKLTLNLQHATPQAAADLPPQLQELKLLNPKTKQLQALRSGAGLQRLEVCDVDLDVKATAVAAPPQGLRRLKVDFKNPEVAFALIAACAATLQELEVGCASFPGSGFYEPDLAGRLKDCGFKVLRRLELNRKSGIHSRPTCAEQISAVEEALAGVDAGRQLLVVLCSACVECLSL